MHDIFTDYSLILDGNQVLLLIVYYFWGEVNEAHAQYLNNAIKIMFKLGVSKMLLQTMLQIFLVLLC